MKRIDYLITLTKAILETPEKNIEEILTYFGSIFEFHEVQKPGVVSLVAGLESGQEVSFSEWVKLLRIEKVKKCRIRSVVQEQDQLPAHIAAAFAGTQEYLFEVITEKTARCYIIKTFYSPSYAITPDLFAELTDAQLNSEALWKLVARMITESNEMNGRKAVEENGVRAYLNSTEGKEVFNFLASNLAEEMQIECIVTGSAFIFPDHLKHLFYQSDFSFGGADREIAFLYPEKHPSPEQLTTLIYAQPFVADVWECCEAELAQYPLPVVPALKASEFEAYIKGQTTEQLYNSGMTSTICRAICLLCEQHHARPVIPAELVGVFGPDKKEYDKAIARGRSDKDKWYLKSMEQGWEVNFFEPLPITTLLAPKDDFMLIKQNFEKALKDIAEFAEKIQSPFAEAFRFAAWFIERKIPAGDFDAEHIEAIKEALEEDGFTERAIEVLQNNAFYLEEWHKMHYSTEVIYNLFAVKCADVFGGMGSWNDQYLENDQEEFDRVSAETFAAMKNYFVAILSK